MRFTVGVATGLTLYAYLAHARWWRRFVHWVFTRDQRAGWFT